MNRTARYAARGILIVCVAALSAVNLAAQGQGVGAIGGTIADASGAVLPGVSVTLTSTQGVIGGNQDTVSDERGTYQFLRLVPGSYVVRAALQGFGTVERPGISVTSDTTTRVDLRMQVGSVEETIQVTADVPLLDTTNASRTALISRDEMEALPNRTDIWSMSRAIPGIVIGTVDVGGTGEMQSSTAAVHGSSSENKWMVDGFDDSSLSGGGTIANFYLDPYMYEETTFVLGAGSAENSAGGLTFNMVTRSGTNRWHGGTKFNGTTPGLSNSESYSPELKAQLLSNVPARVLTLNPNFVPNSDIHRMTDAGAWIGGPIKRDKLWFVAAVHDQRLDNNQLGSYDSNGTPVVQPNTLWNDSVKLSYQLAKTAQLSYFVDIQRKLQAANGGATFATTAAHQYNIKYPTVHQIKFTVPIGSKLAVEAGYNRFRNDNSFLAEPDVPVGAVATYDTTTQVGTTAFSYYYDNDMYRDQLKGSLTWSTGKHLVKTGYEYVRAAKTARYWSSSAMQANFANGVPVSVNTLLLPIPASLGATPEIPGDIPLLYSYKANVNAAYVQDKWTVTQKLVVNLGLRFETDDAWQLPSARPTTIWYPGATYGEVRAPVFRNFSPRLNLVYDVMSDGKTVIKFAASRYDQPADLALLDRINPVVAQSGIPGGSAAAIADTRQWLPQTSCALPGVLGCDRNGDRIPQINEVGPSPGYVFPAVTATYAPDLKRPIADEYTLEFQRQFGSIVFSIDYVVRKTRNNIGQMNTAAPPSSYTGPFTVTEVTSGQTVQVWNRGTSAASNLFFNDPNVDTNYHGTDITISKRLSDRWSVLAGATFGRVTAATRGGDENNPNLTNPVPFNTNVITVDDRPWMYKASGTYQFPRDIMVSGSWQLQTGPPETTTVLVTSQTRTLAQGNQSVQVAPTGNTWFPNQGTFDLNVRKAIRLPGHTTLSPRFEMFNVSNRSTVTSWITQLGPTYHFPSLVQRPRMIKLELSLDF